MPFSEMDIGKRGISDIIAVVGIIFIVIALAAAIFNIVKPLVMKAGPLFERKKMQLPVSGELI